MEVDEGKSSHMHTTPAPSHELCVCGASIHQTNVKFTNSLEELLFLLAIGFLVMKVHSQSTPLGGRSGPDQTVFLLINFDL